ncbi:UBN2_3 domain-containing protein [Cephalotus follicularis]|uniref:UBN2_3 domain-containing protein n=1 Tax=Cephalotus follicularis TaxID=3775 RepID=A0A1Q3CJC6_CEPFO|nr:UBN2_3 domain-containing protein [Cephalotus follicularis]
MTTIDFNDPIYLHPSDTPGINLVTEQLIGNENYGVWSRAMLIALRAKNKVGFINGSCLKPDQNSPLLHQWERCNAIVLSWIINTVSKELLGGIVYATDALAVWRDLKERFDRINGSRIFSIHRDIVCLSQGSATVSVYFSKLRELWDEYASLVTLPSYGCPTSRAYLEHDQQQRLLQFLMGLNDSYGSIRSQILMMCPLPTVSQAYSMISQEESHRGIIAGTHKQSDVPAVFYSNTYKKKENGVKCDYCNLSGHTKETCYKLVGYPSWHKLYKGKKGDSFFFNQRFTKGGEQNKRHMVNNSISETETDVKDGQPASPLVFTPSQYQQILKLLSKDDSNEEQTDHMANLAGIFTSLMSV